MVSVMTVLSLTYRSLLTMVADVLLNGLERGFVYSIALFGIVREEVCENWERVREEKKRLREDMAMQRGAVTH